MHLSVSSVPPTCIWRIMKIRIASSELSDIKSKISRQAFWLTDYPTYRAFPVTPVALMRCSSPNTVTAGMRWILTIFPFNIPHALKGRICSAPDRISRRRLALWDGFVNLKMRINPVSRNHKPYLSHRRGVGPLPYGLEAGPKASDQHPVSAQFLRE